MDPQLTLAILTGKVIAYVLKLTGSGATAAPGLYALKIDPNLVKKLTERNAIKAIVISGTNGKTTTSRLIYEILHQPRSQALDHDDNKAKSLASKERRIIHNRAGSNLLRGVASTLIEKSSSFGQIEADLAIWEADEAALLPISKNIKIDTLVLLNLFRDQLDRYGEIDTTRKKWVEVVSTLPKSSTLILNSDDPSTNYLAKFTGAKVIFFGVETDKINLPQIENVADVKYCINCSHKLSYETLYSAHLGKYSCQNCSFKRNAPQIKATKLNFNNFKAGLELSINDKRLTINVPLPGLYNVYNVLAAASVATTYKIGADRIKTVVGSFSAAFGRFQKTKINGTELTTLLIKNPAGANEVIRTISTKSNLNILAVLNDNIADGRDVSWIWDTNWEALQGKISSLNISGTRAYDLALRLKYADIPIGEESIDTNIKSALDKSVKSPKNLIILPTYTAMLELQKLMGGKWHKE